MGPIFAFFTGLLSMGGAYCMVSKEQRDCEKRDEFNWVNGYNPTVQSRYDNDDGRIYSEYSINKMMRAIQRDYPRMSDTSAFIIAKASVAKKLMESETNYRYRPSERVKYFDLDKYATDENKIKEGESIWEVYLRS